MPTNQALGMIGNRDQQRSLDTSDRGLPGDYRVLRWAPLFGGIPYLEARVAFQTAALG